MTGPVEGLFGSIEAAPLPIGRAGWHGRKMATLQWLWSKFLPLLTLLPPGPIVSRLIEEATTSTNWSSHSNLRVGGVQLTALSLGLAEDSSASCLLARGPRTQLNMVVGEWLVATLRLLHFETLHHVFPDNIHKLTNSLPQLPHTFSQWAEVWIPRWIVLLCLVLKALTISYC